LRITPVATLGPQHIMADFITYFGYGSLVNRATRPAHETALRARLYGWQRVWGHRVLPEQQPSGEPPRSCCSLSVEKLPKTASEQSKKQPYIDGVIVTIPTTDLPVLDKREAGYNRHALSSDHFDLPPECKTSQVHVYVSKPDHQGGATEQFPILQSYIDCVLAGYGALFEHDGMQQFIDSTTGWDGVIENERNNPKYPRAVSLPVEQLALFDRMVNARRIEMHRESN